jgi:hypothetical protein
MSNARNLVGCLFVRKAVSVSHTRSEVTFQKTVLQEVGAHKMRMRYVYFRLLVLWEAFVDCEARSHFKPSDELHQLLHLDAYWPRFEGIHMSRLPAMGILGLMEMNWSCLYACESLDWCKEICDATVDCEEFEV